MLSIHLLGIKTNEYSNDNYGFKNPVAISIRNMRSIRVSILLKKYYKQVKLSLLTN